MAAPSLMIAAPSSGSGKTTITLALLRAFKNRGLTVSSFKIGPDYIDPAFHAFASKRKCYNLDPWAMSEETLTRIATDVTEQSDLVIGEAVMGLFDGARDGTGSSADLANILNIPVLLVVDAKGQAASVGALLHGFNSYRPGIRIAGVIFNKVGSANHRAMLIKAADTLNIPVVGCIPRSADLILSDRHLGLVQAREKVDINTFLDNAAEIIETNAKLDQIMSLATPPSISTATQNLMPPPGQRISIAEDNAFAFTYPHLVDIWQKSGAEISVFSPLKDETPDEQADFIYLPGGYPELFAGTLFSANKFKSGMQRAAKKGTAIYGECGGYMTLGRGLTDRAGDRFEMLNLLPVETSFAKPKLHLGYRNVTLSSDCMLARKGTKFKAHEFHYASVTAEETTSPLFSTSDATGDKLGQAGTLTVNVAGSFIHLIDRVKDD